MADVSQEAQRVAGLGNALAGLQSQVLQIPNLQRSYLACLEHSEFSGNTRMHST